MKSLSSILQRLLQQFSKRTIFSNFVHQTTDFHYTGFYLCALKRALEPNLIGVVCLPNKWMLAPQSGPLPGCGYWPYLVGYTDASLNLPARRKAMREY